MSKFNCKIEALSMQQRHEIATWEGGCFWCWSYLQRTSWWGQSCI